jgi:hypothetical protein
MNPGASPLQLFLLGKWPKNWLLGNAIYLNGREPAMRISTSILALCCQLAPEPTTMRKATQPSQLSKTSKCSFPLLVRSGLIAGLAFAATEEFIIQVSSLAFGDRTPLRSRIPVSRDLRSGFNSTRQLFGSSKLTICFSSGSR